MELGTVEDQQRPSLPLWSRLESLQYAPPLTKFNGAFSTITLGLVEEIYHSYACYMIMRWYDLYMKKSIGQKHLNFGKPLNKKKIDFLHAEARELLQIDKEFKYKVNIPLELPNYPTTSEITSAYILAKYLKCDVDLLIPSNISHTADFYADSKMIEVKTPIGNGKNTISHQFDRAKKQSKNIIINIKNMKNDECALIREIKRQFRLNRTIKNLYIIDKNNKILVLTK